jgi:protein-tyrosine phosphatase
MRAQLYSIHDLPTGQVSIAARPRGGDWLIDEIKALCEAGVDVLVSLLTETEEAELDLDNEGHDCRQQNITYLNFPILDRCVPPFTASTFAVIEQLSEQLAAGKHIALHCRQGLGRSVLMAACLLVCAGMTPEQACNQLTQARGCPVPETAEQRAWIVAFSQQHNRLSGM